MRNRRFALSLVLAPLLAPAVARAHGGGLDANGCHTDGSTGERHCHEGADAPRKSLVKATQSLLAALDYKIGEPDGVAGASTLEALRKFADDHGKPVRSRIDDETVLALAVAVRERKPCRR